MSTSQCFDFDEIPIRTKDGAVVAYAIFDGYADLAVGDDDGSLYLDYVEAIHVRDANDERWLSLDESDPAFIAIEFEIERLADAGQIKFERPGPDPDYLRDLRLDAAE